VYAANELKLYSERLSTVCFYACLDQCFVILGTISGDCRYNNTSNNNNNNGTSLNILQLKRAIIT